MMGILLGDGYLITVFLAMSILLLFEYLAVSILLSFWL